MWRSRMAIVELASFVVFHHVAVIVASARARPVRSARGAGCKGARVWRMCMLTDRVCID